MTGWELWQVVVAWILAHPLESVAMCLILLSVWLNTREHVGGFGVGMAGVMCYAWIYWQERLYASALLQVFFWLLMAYGWYAWCYGGAQRTGLRVRSASLRYMAGLLALCVPVAVLAGWYFDHYTASSHAYLDWMVTVLSLGAQWLLSRKYLQNWLWWILINVLSVWLYTSQGLYLTGGLYVLLTLMAVEGWRNWHKKLISA